MSTSFVTIKAVSTPVQMNPGTTTTISNLSNLGIPSNTKIVRHLQYVTQAPPTSSTVSITKGQTIITGPGIKNQPVTKTIVTQPQSKPTILSNIILTPKQGGQAQQQYTVINSGGQQQLVQRVVVSGQQTVNIPSLTSTVARAGQPTIIQPVTSQNQGGGKIVQIKTAPTILSVAQQQNAMQNIPPLIATQQPQLLNFQNIQGQQRKTVTITAQPNQLPTGNVQRITLSQAQAQVAQQQQQNLQQQVSLKMNAFSLKYVIFNQNFFRALLKS